MCDTSAAHRELGLGPGGFYTPSYGPGQTMHLRMMCLGEWCLLADMDLNWRDEQRSCDMMQLGVWGSAYMGDSGCQPIRAVLERSNSTAMGKSRNHMGRGCAMQRAMLLSLSNPQGAPTPLHLPAP